MRRTMFEDSFSKHPHAGEKNGSPGSWPGARGKGTDMNKKVIVAGLLALTLGTPLAACGNSNSGSTTSTTPTTATSAKDSGDSGSSDMSYYAGQWRGSVETTGKTVYGNAGTTEQMLDVNLNKDGSFEVKPLEAHKDLPSKTGTWKLEGKKIVLDADGTKIELTVKSDAVLTGKASDFGIKDFDTINFDYYG